MIINTFALTGRHYITLRITLGAASLAQGYGQSLGFQPAQIEFLTHPYTQLVCILLHISAVHTKSAECRQIAT